MEEVFGPLRSKSGQKKYNDVMIFNTEKLEWKKVNAKGKLPVMSTSTAMFAIGSCFYIYGGGHNNDTTVSSDMFCFDTVSLTWNEVTPKNKEQINERGRDCATACVYKDAVYLYGGNYSFFYGNEQDFCLLRINYKPAC